MSGNTVLLYGSSIAFLLSLYAVLKKLLSKRQQVSVKDKVVVITGASSGLGEACAHEFYKAGAKVILCARRQKELERVKNNLKLLKCDNQHEPHIVPLDLSDFNDIPIQVRKAYDLYSRIDILINNGGISYRGEVMSTDISVHHQLMAVNYFGQVVITKEVVKHMLKDGSGHVVFVSSVQGKISIPYRSAYSASKHALQAFSDSLRAEMATKNIYVSSVSPGYIKTNLSLNAVCADGSNYGVMDPTTASGLNPENVARNILQCVTHQEQEVVVAPLFHRIAVMFRNIFPDTYFKIMNSRAKKEGKKKL